MFGISGLLGVDAMSAPCIPGLLDPIMHALPPAPRSLVETLAAYFRARPRQWIDGLALAQVAGSYAWRSRLSELRRPPFTMTIENRQYKRDRFTVSEYRFVPEEAHAAPPPADAR